jgi:hypothetical protein
MVEVDDTTPLIGEHGALTLLDAFEGRQLLIAYYFMWYTGRPAAEQCEGCTLYTAQVRELSFLHSRDVTYATFCQGPYEESARYHDFMGWKMPWYSAQDSLDTRLVGRRVGMMHIRRRRLSLRPVVRDGRAQAGGLRGALPNADRDGEPRRLGRHLHIGR